MSPITIIMLLAATIWVLSGVLTYGFVFAYLQGEYHLVAKENYIKDVGISSICALLGPIGLIGVAASIDTYDHGWRWR